MGEGREGREKGWEGDRGGGTENKRKELKLKYKVKDKTEYYHEYIPKHVI